MYPITSGINIIIFCCEGSTPGLRRHLLRQELRNDQNHRQHVDGQRFRLRKIVHPQPARAAQLDRHAQHLVKREEERKLDHHRQTAAHRIHAVLLVQIHDFLVLLGLLRIVQRQVLYIWR